MEKKTNNNLPKGFVIALLFFISAVAVVYFGFIQKDSDLHGGDSILQVTATANIVGDNAVTPIPELEGATPAPGLSQEISKLSVADTADVIFLAIENENKAECTFKAFTRSGGRWTETFETSGFIGKNGVNYETRRENDYTTPGGIYAMKECFGISEAPENMSLDYIKVTKAHYWDGDQNSEYYNTMVDSGKMPEGWNKGAGEHLIEYKEQYRYCINVGFNCDPAIPGVGFAIFLHCTRDGMTNTAGCIAIPEEYMVKCIEMATENTYIVILKDVADLENAEEINNK